MKEIAVSVLVWAAVASQLVCAIALLRMRTTYDRIHFASLAGIAGVLLVAIALGLTVSFNDALKLAFVAAVALAANAVNAHILGSAARLSEDER